MFYEVHDNTSPDGLLRLRITFKDYPKSDSEFDEFLEKLDFYYKKNQKFSMLIDTTKIVPPLKYASGMAHFMKTHENESRELLIKTAIVMINPISRNFLKVLFKIRKPVSPLQVFESLREAVNYLEWIKK